MNNVKVNNVSVKTITLEELLVTLNSNTRLENQ